jgi:hypothetical protein
MGKALVITLILIVVLSGAVVGVWAVGGFQYLNLNLGPKTLSHLSKDGPVTSEPVSFSLNLSSPDDNLLVFSSDLLISGQAAPGAAVIISFEGEDLVVEPSKTGEFSLTAKLDEGINQFTVSAFDNNGNSKSENRTVYYSKEKI